MTAADTTSAEIAVVVLLATAFLIIASTAPMRIAVGALLLLAPFHLVEELDITNSIAMAYMVVLAIMLRGGSLKVPMLGSMLLVLLAYLISITQVHPSLYRWHAVTLIILGSGFIVFVLAYNLARTTTDARTVVNIVLGGNVLVDLYCIVQLIAGPGVGTSLFGLEALSMEANRGEGDPRLAGPFGGAPGILAQYLALLTLVGVYDALHSAGGRRIRVWLLIAVNVGLIVATANRGGFITLVVGLAAFLFIFRKELGTIRVIQLGGSGLIMLVAASLVVVNLTDFNIMFDRLGGVTEVEGGVPQTRQQVWPQAWERFKDVPWFGQGPTWRLPMEHLGATYPGRIYIEYPHSLYLFLLVSVGIVGTAAFAFFLLVLWGKLLRASKMASGRTDYIHGLVRMGPMLLLLFLLDQIRIEFLRPPFADYQHVVFGLLGLWLGMAHHVQSMEPVRALPPAIDFVPTKLSQRWVGDRRSHTTSKSARRHVAH